MNHIDLFSGIGGFSLAAKWSGIDTIAFCEKDEFCKKVLKKHWPNVPIYDDIKTLNFTEKVDLLTAGFPCQPFSVAGKRKGKEDDRYLWPDTRRIISESKPSWIVLENVPGIIPHIDPIIKDLESENYKFQSFIIPASSLQAPHRRDRLWIIANSNSKRFNNRINYWEERHIQSYKERYIKEIQSKWTQLKPESWETYKTIDWFRFNAFAPRKNDGLSNELDRNKSLGNAIVPQIAYIFFEIILSIEKEFIC